MEHFKEQERDNPPVSGGILFLGSSTIRHWDLKRHFPELPVVNRGFGGSTYADINHYRDQLLLPWAPKVVVLYAGDNDVAQGQSPEAISIAFKSLLDWLHDTLPETRVLLLGIKPSLARWSMWETMQNTNARLKSTLELFRNTAYLDCAALMLDGDGKPNPAMLGPDGLHLSEAGYARWSDAVRPLLSPKNR